MPQGVSGNVMVVIIMCLVYKAHAYYTVPWRRSAGGGPILINMIHKIDLVRHLCGEVIAVQAASSNRTRGHEVAPARRIPASPAEWIYRRRQRDRLTFWP